MTLAFVELTDNRGRKLKAQFNPETLTIEHQTHGEESRKRSGEQASRGGNVEAGQAGVRTASSAVSSVTLLFDTSDTGSNVRENTLTLLAMMTPEDNSMPVVTFQYGTLMFTVTITGFTEELTYFSEQGVPLRARVNLRMTEAPTERAASNLPGLSGGIGLSASASLGASIGASAGVSAGASFGASASGSVEASVSAGLSAGASIGTTPLSFSQGGQSLQQMAAGAGVDWKVVAEANGIENPRQLDAGAAVNLNVG